MKVVGALVSLAILGLFSSVAACADAAWTPPGPAVGAMFPVALDAPDQMGKPRTLKSLMGTKGIAVFFVRSADWCPFCKGQLARVNQRHAEFTRLGFNVVSVSVDEVAEIAAFAQQQSITYTMLADPKGDINLKLGIRDEQYPVGSHAYGVPRPAIYVLDTHGMIRARYMEPTYRTRPDLDKVLSDVAALKP